MESSICVWLASANVVWQSVELNSPLTNTPESSSPLQILKAKIKNNLKNSPTLSKPPVGFINKGNICYAKTILQALSVIPLFWGPSYAESAQLSPLLQSIALNMDIKIKNQLCQLILQFFCEHSSAKFHLLPVLLLILTYSRMLQKFYT